MSLPNQLKSARMTDATLGVDIDNKVAEIEQALCDIFGFTINTNVTESPTGCDNSGRFTKALLRQLAAGPVGWRFRDSTSGKEFRLAMSGTNIVIDENTGSEGTPTWTNRASMAIATGVWTFTGIPVGPASSPTSDNQLARKKYVDDLYALAELLSHKGAASGYCDLDSGTKVPTNRLGTGTPSSSNYLRGDRSWATVPQQGKVVQQVHYSSGEVFSTTATIPYDDTKPQSTEGAEWAVLAITPVSADNYLLVEVKIQIELAINRNAIAALFRDGGADALACGFFYGTGNSGNYCMNVISFAYRVLAGSASATTFKVRVGCSGTNNLTVNGYDSSRKYGGALASTITITEITP